MAMTDEARESISDLLVQLKEKVVAAMDNKGAIETFQRIAKVRGTAVARAEGERCTICQVRLRPAVWRPSAGLRHVPPTTSSFWRPLPPTWPPASSKTWALNGGWHERR